MKDPLHQMRSVYEMRSLEDGTNLQWGEETPLHGQRLFSVRRIATDGAIDYLIRETKDESKARSIFSDPSGPPQTHRASEPAESARCTFIYPDGSRCLGTGNSHSRRAHAFQSVRSEPCGFVYRDDGTRHEPCPFTEADHPMASHAFQPRAVPEGPNAPLAVRHDIESRCGVPMTQDSAPCFRLETDRIHLDTAHPRFHRFTRVCGCLGEAGHEGSCFNVLERKEEIRE